MNKKELYESILRNVSREVKKAINENEYWDEPAIEDEDEQRAPHAGEIVSLDIQHDDFYHHVAFLDDQTGVFTVYGYDSIQDLLDLYFENADDLPEINWLREVEDESGEVFHLFDKTFFKID